MNQSVLKRIAAGAVILAAAWLTVRYLTPFVLALALALAAEPLVNVLQRRLHLPRWISSGAGVTVTLTWQFCWY